MALSLHDHALVHAVGLLSRPRWGISDPEGHDLALTLSVLKDVLPECRSTDPALAPLAGVAHAFLRSRPEGRRGLVPQAEAAIDAWDRNRLALAWDRIRVVAP